MIPIVLLALLAAACTSGPGASSTAPRRSPTPREEIRFQDRRWFRAACGLPKNHLQRIRRGFFPGRSPDVIMVPKEPNYFGGFLTGSHSGPWSYLQDVPLVFYGPGFIRSQGEIALDRETTVADLAPTLAELLHLKWPSNRAGRPVTEALLDEEQRRTPPRVILVIAWDGGGWNVLNRWPDAWPTLHRIARKGTSVAGVTVGSSPSVTPATHATMGTGVFPRRHGIVDIPLRDGDEIVGSFANRSPTYLRVPALADLHDAAVDNQAQVGIFSYKSWHWGMMGKGAFLEGGDKDIAVISESGAGELITNPEWYSLPDYVLRIPGFEDDVVKADAEDGRRDGLWMGHDTLNDPSDVRETPAWIFFQNRIIETLLEREGFGQDPIPDLFFTNYKQLDEIGHSYNMVNTETEEILRHTDDALDQLIGFLDAEVGRNRWVIAVTADHGQTPSAETTGAWPIRMVNMEKDLARRFDTSIGDLIAESRVTGLWLTKEALEQKEISAQAIADYLLDYTIGENHQDGEELPSGYRDRMDEKIFDAVFPSGHLDKVWKCARAKD